MEEAPRNFLNPVSGQSRPDLMARAAAFLSALAGAVKPGEAAPPRAAQRRTFWGRGIYAALSSAFFLGIAPVFGKQAILLGLHPLAVAALRTLFATLLLLGLIALFNRKYLFIYPAGLLGCLLAGWINGLGSLFYYSALGRIDASVGQLLYSLYPLFLVIWLALDRQAPSRLTVIRISLALPAILLLTQAGDGQIDWTGVVFMLLGSALYALHLPINQRVLYDMPAPTVTVYTLLAMSSVVVPAYLFSGIDAGALQASAIWTPLLALTVVTFLSRLTLFMGVKHLGGMQTALLGLSEVLVTVLFAHAWLGERLSLLQWAGAVLLMVSLLLVLAVKPGSEAQTKPPHAISGGRNPRRANSGWLSWLQPPGLANYDLSDPTPARPQPARQADNERQV